MANFSTAGRRPAGSSKNHAANIRARGADKSSSLGGGTGIKAPEAQDIKGLKSNIGKFVKAGKVVPKALKVVRSKNKTPQAPKSAGAIAGKSNADSFVKRVIGAIKNTRGNANTLGSK